MNCKRRFDLENSKKNILVEIIIVLLSYIFFMFFISTLGIGDVPWIAIIFNLAMGIIPIELYKSKNRHLETLGFTKKNPIMQLMISLILLIILIMVFIAIPMLFGVEKSYLVAGRIDNIKEVIFQFFFMIFCLGFGEEVLFRGFLLERILALTSSKNISILTSSMIFGVVHYILNRNIFQVLIASIIGMVFATAKMYIKHCTLYTLILVHGLFNFSLILLRCTL